MHEPDHEPDSGADMDPALARAFAEARTPPADGAFEDEVMDRILKARRVRSVRAMVVVGAFLAAAAALSPWVAQGSLAVSRRLSFWLPALGQALASPVGWVCALAVAAWSLRRAGVIGRSRGG
jgi:hypothetical protein